MMTLLTTSKMAPALALRIEDSVRGRRHSRTRGVSGPRLATWFRLGVLVAVASAAASLVHVRGQVRAELESSRAKVLSTLERHVALLTTRELGVVSRVEPWLIRTAGVYEGDFVAAPLRQEGALRAALSRPALYVRGPASELKTRTGIATASATSLKDPFLLCLLDPPPARTEKAMLPKVHAAYSGGAHLEAATATVHRLYDAEAGLPLLMPAFAARVRTAEDAVALGHLAHDLQAAPVDAAAKAAKAQVLLYAVDEPGDASGLSELDGERPHDVRVGLVDLVSETESARLRRHVDPAFISLAKRSQYSAGLDGCALAVDVRAAVTLTPAP